jgi:hypothetical protein
MDGFIMAKIYLKKVPEKEPESCEGCFFNRKYGCYATPEFTDICASENIIFKQIPKPGDK